METAPRRRNGRLQACDPCRRRKMACDHTQPVCNRCRNRGQAIECVYTGTIVRPSNSIPPETSAHASPQTAAAASPSSRSSQRHAQQQSPGQPQPQPQPTQAHVQSPSSVIRSLGAGYLGFTSHSAVFDETRQRLSHVSGLSGLTPLTAGMDDADANATRGGGMPWMLLPATLETCQTILLALPDLSKITISPPSFAPVTTDGWARVAASRIVQALHAKLPVHPPTKDEVAELARLLHDNTARPVSDDLADPDEWIAQFTGNNVRWESVAMLFTFPELFAEGRAVTSGGSGGGMWHVPSKQVLLECIDNAVKLAMYQTSGNLLLLWTCARRTFLESIILGDASLHCLRAHADSVSLLLFLGLHVEQPTPAYKPTFCSHLKRIMAARVFTTDKVISSFQGRPPLLSRRYVTTPMPLDLSDRCFFTGMGDLDAAVQELSPNGWNVHGEVFFTSVIRARAELAHVRDNILEIALGNGQDVTIDTLLNIKAKELSVVSGFSPGLLWDPQDIENTSLNVEDVVYGKTLIQIEHLQALFFIERLLLRHGYADEGALLAVSYELLTLTLSIWVHKDRFSSMRRDFEWLVMAYAAPGGGILCMELLKPTFTGPHARNPGITRSSIIQQLSLLVSFLNWVGPDAPNADLCHQCSSIIQHVLDQTLNSVGSGGGLTDALGQFDSSQMNFNFDLLDTYDWLRAEDFMSDL